MGYKQTNSRGMTYYLNCKETVLNGGRTMNLYYFSKDDRPEACDIPEDREVTENSRTGMLFLRKKV